MIVEAPFKAAIFALVALLAGICVILYDPSGVTFAFYLLVVIGIPVLYYTQVKPRLNRRSPQVETPQIKPSQTIIISAPVSDVVAALAKENKSLQARMEIMNKLVLKDNEASALESAGDVDGAITLYEQLLVCRYPHPGPYERLRILYGKQKRYADAIRVCETFIAVQKIADVQYPEVAQKFFEWIPKLQKKMTKF